MAHPSAGPGEHHRHPHADLEFACEIHARVPTARPRDLPDTDVRAADGPRHPRRSHPRADAARRDDEI
jgi:hypothetical protein